MAIEPVLEVKGRGVYVPGSDIDTDRIIPARFMKCVTFDGLGEYAFYDVRFKDDGSEKPHPMNEARFADASVLLTGSNFGCGSSREHAPQALYRWGIRAVIAESFAEIFFGNCVTLGIPCVAAAGEDIERLAAEMNQNPQLEIRIDLEKQRVFFGDDGQFPFHLPDTALEALTSGRWDPIAELLEHTDAVDERVEALNLI